MTLHLSLGEGGYDIIIDRGSINRAGEELDLNRKVLVVTDDGVPSAYSEKVASFCKQAYIVTLNQGEKNKNFSSYIALCEKLLEYGFTRTDCIVAVGGGVVGDMAGFAAATYMRGIDFYNIPTTLLSQVDSSVGGKTGIDLNGVKNIVGAFKQPKKVIIDPDLLLTLSERQLSNGIAESVKMALTCDEDLFLLIESGVTPQNLQDIITKSIQIKKSIVEQDEKESGLRRVLNFGHTVGHGIEADNADTMLHGECVALGMLPMCSEAVRNRLVSVLKALKLPTEIACDIRQIIKNIKHDKKTAGDSINLVFVCQAGSFELKKMPMSEFENYLNEVLQ